MANETQLYIIAKYYIFIKYFVVIERVDKWINSYAQLRRRVNSLKSTLLSNNLLCIYAQPYVQREWKKKLNQARLAV
jgi:hypothetical protein